MSLIGRNVETELDLSLWHCCNLYQVYIGSIFDMYALETKKHYTLSSREQTASE